MGQHYQYIDNGRWTDILTLTASSFDVLAEPWVSSERSTGWAFEMVDDKSGNILASDGEAYNSIANSGSTDNNSSLAQRCEMEKENFERSVKSDVEKDNAACSAVIGSMPFADKIALEVELEKLGMKVSMEANRPDVCSVGAKVNEEWFHKTPESVYNDCMENPGEYFPADYAPEIDKIRFKDLRGFAVPYSTTLTLGPGQSCPATDTREETVDMGDGSKCTATVKRTCAQTANSCECTNPEIIGNIICEYPGTPVPE